MRTVGTLLGLRDFQMNTPLGYGLLQTAQQTCKRSRQPPLNCTINHKVLVVVVLRAFIQHFYSIKQQLPSFRQQTIAFQRQICAGFALEQQV